MQNEIYKITLINLGKATGLVNYVEYQSAFGELNHYLKSDIEENQQLQNTQNIKFVVHVSKSILSNTDNKTIFPAMQYGRN